MKQTIIKSLIWWLVFSFTVLLVSFTYAAITSVSSWDTLTATLWNDMKTMVDGNTSSISTNAWNISTNTTKLTNIESSGWNVWIGTASPATKLEVNGVVKSDNSIKAYASFNWDGWVTIYDSYWVSSIVRNSEWNYTITWDTPFADRNYVIIGSCNFWWSWWANFGLEWNNITWHSYEWLYTTSAKIWCRTWANANADSRLIHFTVIWNQ